MDSRFVWVLAALSASLAVTACNGSTCSGFGGSFSVTKEEVYRALSSDAGTSDVMTVDGAPTDDAADDAVMVAQDATPDGSELVPVLDGGMAEAAGATPDSGELTEDSGIATQAPDGSAGEAPVADAGVGPDSGSVPCPTREEISRYIRLTWQTMISPSEIGEANEQGETCIYPIRQAICR